MSVEGAERKSLFSGRVGPRLRVAIEYAPMGLLAILLSCTLLVLHGRSSEGMWGEVYDSLRGRLAGEDHPALDRVTPQPPIRHSRPVVLTPPPTAALLPLFTPPSITATVPCPSFHFRGTFVVKDGYASFGSFNTVTNTDPYGEDDPLASWKLVQCERFPLSLAGEEKGGVLDIPVNREVNLVIVDPFTREPLLAARWHVASVGIRGRAIEINAGLEENLAQVRVNNAIDSPTLAAFTTSTAGVLVLTAGHETEVLRAIRLGEPVYAPMSGFVRVGGCDVSHPVDNP